MKHRDRVSYNRAMTESWYLTHFAPKIRELAKDLGDDFNAVLQALQEDGLDPPNSKDWTRSKLRYHLRKCRALGIDFIDEE